MEDVLGKVAERAKWSRMKRKSSSELSPAQQSAMDRWRREAAYGGRHLHSARRRAQEDLDAIAAEQRQQAHSRWLVDRDMRKHQMTLKNDLEKARITGRFQKETAEATAKGVVGAAQAPYNIDYLKEKDALDVAREEKQHARALELAREQAKGAAAADQAKHDHELRIEQEKTQRELLSRDDKRAEHFKRGKEFFEMAKRAESGNMSAEDMEALDRRIELDNKVYDTPEKKAQAKAAYRSKLGDPAMVRALMEEYKKEMAAAGYTL